MPDLPDEAFQRTDSTPDEHFYQYPRFVAHIDDSAITEVTELYREHIPANSTVLDLMSSWISHLPEEVGYHEVHGLGMNREELAANRQLNHWVVQNLNENPVLPYDDNYFDAVTICVSVDYLTQPINVFKEIYRVLKPGGVLIITFSNRCFPTKAIALWLRLDPRGQIALVQEYFNQSGSWTNMEALDRSKPGTDPLYAVIGKKK